MGTKRRVLAVVGGAVGVGLLTGAAVLTFGPSTEVLPAAPAGPAAVESACGLPGSSPDTAAAATARWEAAGAYMLPVSDTDGPGQAWSCYARSPSGAVLAGITISLRIGIAEDWQDVVRTQTMPGPGQDAKINGDLSNVEPVTLRGFDLAGYTPDRATVRYYLHTPTIDASCTTDVAWSGGDWRLVLGDDGSTSTGCSQGVPERFTPWGP